MFGLSLLEIGVLVGLLCGFAVVGASLVRRRAERHGQEKVARPDAMGQEPRVIERLPISCRRSRPASSACSAPQVAELCAACEGARVLRIASAYTPRRPHNTALHRLVGEYHATFVAHAEATYAAPLPRYVVNAFERYLACGDFSVLLLLAFVGSGITAAPRPASGTARPAG